MSGKLFNYTDVKRILDKITTDEITTLKEFDNYFGCLEEIAKLIYNKIDLFIDAYESPTISKAQVWSRQANMITVYVTLIFHCYYALEQFPQGQKFLDLTELLRSLTGWDWEQLLKNYNELFLDKSAPFGTLKMERFDAGKIK